MRSRNILIVLIAAVVAVMSFTGVAGANQRFLPNGINSVSPLSAKTQVMQYAEVNDQYGDMLAHQAGRTQFVRDEWVQKGYGKAPSNTLNSSLTPAGTPSKHAGAVGTKTLVLVNIRTKRTVHVMVRCGNPRLSKKGKCDCKPVSVRKVNLIRVFKRFKKTVHHTCPSGQAVTVTVSGTAKGWVRATVWAKVIGSAKIKITNEIALKVSAQISIKCGVPPTTPPPTTPPLPPCPDGMIRNEKGECFRPKAYAKATAKATSYARAECPDGTIAEAKGYGIGEAEAWSDIDYADAHKKAYAEALAKAEVSADADAWATVKCGSNPPPPPPPPPPPTCEETKTCPPPVITIIKRPEHVYTGNRSLLCVKVEVGYSKATVVADSIKFSPLYGEMKERAADPEGRDDVWCQWYKAPDTPATEEVVRVDAKDSVGTSAKAVFMRFEVPFAGDSNPGDPWYDPN